jgi:nucleoside-diphosphate-sugar epimerase
MARVLITGSAAGLGWTAAETLLGNRHEVIVHARIAERLAAVQPLTGRDGAAVAGDVSDVDHLRGPHTLPGNVLAPCPLTVLITRPQRLVYLSSRDGYSSRGSCLAVMAEPNLRMITGARRVVGTASETATGARQLVCGRCGTRRWSRPSGR